MSDFYEVDFLPVETGKSGDAIAIRYRVNGVTGVHVVDGGYLDTGDTVVEHVKTYYNVTHIDHVVLTHPDQDHANGLRKVLESCTVGTLWMNRPWLYAEALIDRFATYESVDALRRKLRSLYPAVAILEDLALEKGITIRSPLQGSVIGPFTVLAPSVQRYMDLIVESEKTPEAVEDKALHSLIEEFRKAIKTATNFVKAAWGAETFPADGTSSENEMSVVQYALINNRKILLTGDAGRQALGEAADYAPAVGLALPGIHDFQVPHHGGRHNVDTAILDRWLGPRHTTQPAVTTWRAVCSSAKADEDHPRKSVVRAMLHRGAWFGATEGNAILLANGISRSGWSGIAQTEYPAEQED
ncbi:competence protein ComEC [Ralstonia pickettii]|nr:competence protein ComEC [Ralstonia pickettii]